MEDNTYTEFVKGKTAEQILQAGMAVTSHIAEYLRVAAQVRSNQELITELRQVSDDSGKMAKAIAWLTAALVFVGLVQAVVMFLHK